MQLLGQRYRDAGLADVTVTLYPEGRHEILNETNRGEVTADIVAWLRAHPEEQNRNAKVDLLCDQVCEAALADKARQAR